ncbi:DUF1508 domain-containing protein [Pseudomonas nicosulfuronedens]|uniref:DUF1508 domain-containing protein n=2 Tax=Pseudomonas nicosulfuronedens TaxID=2571105 RepID=A0A5R9QLR2_9PSED|nr:DUF1508 domain-containing protein [Pseudomonas nicosulfuronedens]TLX70481.1 DUF1508 domain-containing protein [Pseudomonas nicosulfuronedens]
MAEVAYFFIYKDAAKEWRWRFTAKNSKIIAVSSEGYHNLSDCEHSISLLKEQGPTGPVIGDDDYDRLRK